MILVRPVQSISFDCLFGASLSSTCLFTHICIYLFMCNCNMDFSSAIVTNTSKGILYPLVFSGLLIFTVSSEPSIPVTDGDGQWSSPTIP